MLRAFVKLSFINFEVSKSGKRDNCCVEVCGLGVRCCCVITDVNQALCATASTTNSKDKKVVTYT